MNPGKLPANTEPFTTGADAGLAQYCARLERSLRVIDEGIWEWDVAAGKIWFSDRWLAMLGYKDQEIASFLAWQHIIHPDGLGAFLEAWLACEEGSLERFRIEYRVRRKSGEWLWVEAHGMGERDADGFMKLAGCHTDISLRKRYEAEQQDREKLLQEEIGRRTQELELLRELGEAIVSELDLDRVLHLVASKARALIGAETVMVPLLDAGGDAYRYAAADGAHAEAIEQSSFPLRVGMCGWVLRHQKPLLYGEEMIWHADEKTRWEQRAQSALLVPLFGKGRIIGGLSGIGKTGGGSFTRRDLELLTVFANQASIAIENAKLFLELKQLVDTLEQRVAERTAALEAANKELEAFSYSVSHDLRAPLRAIDGFGMALLEDYGAVLEGDGKRYLERLRANTQHMGELIDAMLQLSRITRAETTVQRVDLSALAQEIAARLSAAAPQRPVEFLCAHGVSAQGDPQLLRIVLENLLSNAWKYSAKADRPRVEFGVQISEKRPVYFVRDNGAGFDMAYSGKLFNAFQRLHTANEFPGTGVGLATVKRIIQRHGGTVWAESAPNAGASFYFTLG